MDIMQLLQSGRTAEALELLTRQLSAKPDDILALALYARVMASQGRPEVAVGALHKIISLDQKSGNAWFGLAELARERGDHAEAVRCYKNASECLPDNAVAPYHLGLLYAMHGHPAEARLAYRTALERNREFVEALINLGNLDFQAQDFAAAKTCYEKALAIEPQRAEALAAMALVEQQLAAAAS